MESAVTAGRLLKELEQDVRRHRAVLNLHRGGCGCRLAGVYRLPSGALLLGESRALVGRAGGQAEARRVPVALDLAQIEEDHLRDYYGCAHGQVTVDIGRVRDELSRATRLGRKLFF